MISSCNGRNEVKPKYCLSSDPKCETSDFMVQSKSFARRPVGFRQQFDARLEKSNPPRFVEFAECLLERLFADAEFLADQCRGTVIVEIQASSAFLEGFKNLPGQRCHALIAGGVEAQVNF